MRRRSGYGRIATERRCMIEVGAAAAWTWPERIVQVGERLGLGDGVNGGSREMGLARLAALLRRFPHNEVHVDGIVWELQPVVDALQDSGVQQRVHVAVGGLDVAPDQPRRRA